MAIPKKSSKPIEVDGRKGPHFRLTVEDTETKDVFQQAIVYDLDAPPPTITPAFVRDVIRNLDRSLSR